MAKSQAFAAFVGLLERLDREKPDILRVLTYHRVEWCHVDPAPSPALTISPDAFAEQMRYLHRRYQVVSVEQVIDTVRRRRDLPRRSVLITFDDGYRDFGTHAWPVLRELGLPAVLFVPTAFPGTPGASFWWDRLHHAIMTTARRDGLQTPVGSLPLGTDKEREDAATRLGAHAKQMPHPEAMVWVVDICRELDVPSPPSVVLDWGQLRELAKAGVTIGSHTRTHPLLTRIPTEEVRAEVAGALRDLERELGTVLPILAYPAGAFDDRVVRIVEEEGHVLAFTTVRGVNELARAHPLKLRRINVGRRSSLPVLRAQLMGRSVGLNRFYPLSRPGAAGSLEPTSPPARPTPVSDTPTDPGSQAAPARRPTMAYIVSGFPKLTETFVLYEMVALENVGTRVEFFPLRRLREVKMHAEAARFIERAHFAPYLSVAILGANLYYIARHGVRYWTTWLTLLRGTWGSLRFFVGGVVFFPKTVYFARRMIATGVDHVHAHFANHPAAVAWAIHQLTDIPYSFTAHGSDLHRDRHMLRDKVAEAAFVVTISQYNRRMIIEECGPGADSKVAVIHCGVDTLTYRPGPAPPKAASPGRPFNIFCIGTLHEVKGQTFLLEACRRLADWGIPFVCHLVGDGPDRQSLARQVEEGGIGDRVRFLGWLTRDEVRQALNGADVVAAPSVLTRSGSREGIPVALMEAMACGVPVVASRLSGIPELVEDGKTGLLVEPADVEGLAEALQRLHRDEPLRRQLGAAGRTRVEREFDLRRNVELLLWHFMNGTQSRSHSAASNTS